MLTMLLVSYFIRADLGVDPKVVKIGYNIRLCPPLPVLCMEYLNTPNSAHTTLVQWLVSPVSVLGD